MERQRVLQEFDRQSAFIGKRTAKGIEQHRKGLATLILTDQAGHAIPDAHVAVRQKSHAFRFGANLFMLDEMETAEKNELYKRYFAELFQMATLPFYWDTLEPERGKPRYAADSPKIYRRPAPDLCLAYCKEHGIEPREHALAYDSFFPKWLYDAPVSEVKTALEHHFAEIAERYADEIRTIEVTNEMEWDAGKTRFYDEPDFVEWCFRTAERYFPKNQLVINEWTGLCWEDRCRATDKYYAYTEAAIQKGAKIDAIGMQYHLFNPREREFECTRKTLNPENLYRHMDLYAGLGRPLQITEVTVPAYSWNDEDEAIQAKILENLYTIWFSHPSVEQIIYWNLVDGYAFVRDATPENIRASQGDMTLGENYYHGGLLRFDLSPKPAYYALKKLTQQVWHTEEVLTTDSDGAASLNGFYGDYELEISTPSGTCFRSATLAKGERNCWTLTI